VSAAGNGSADNLAPAPALDADGNLVTVWGASGFFAAGILARHFDAAGKPGPPEIVISSPGLRRIAPAIIPFGPTGPSPTSRFLATWTNTFPPGATVRSAALGDPNTLSARLLDGAGVPAGPEFRADVSGVAAYNSRIAALPGGGGVASWESDHLVARFLDTAGQPVGGEIDVAPPHCLPKNVGLAGLPGGGFLALWSPAPEVGPDCTGLQGQVFGADGKPAGAHFTVPWAPAVAIAPGGNFLTLATAGAGPDRELHATLYSAFGFPLGTAWTLASTAEGSLTPVAAGVDDAGRFLALWTTNATSAGTVLHARLLDTTGAPIGDAFTVGSRADGAPFSSVQATGRAGEWAVTWTGTPPLHSGDDEPFARLFASCPGLCLNGSRFIVTVAWTNPRNGSTGTGHALPLTGDTGGFWFFDPRNVELNVKVLDGRGVNGHFWVFYASLSDVEFTITVTDTETGAVKTFHNPPYTLASRADVTAF
jgi:hypothetical protein